MLALAFAATPAHPLHAQSAAGAAIASVASGSRVRITMRGEAPFVGALLRQDSATVVAELPSGASLAVERSRMARLEVSGGVRRHTWQGAGIGLVAGAGIGTAIALATYRRTECIDSAIARGIVCPFIDEVSRQTTVFVDASLIGAAGSIVGALIGHAGRETWIPVAVARASGVALPSAHRVGWVLPVSTRAIGVGISAGF